jgi:hypothetical protein
MNSTEEQEQMAVAELLDIKKIRFCHVPNEGKHKVQYRVKQKRLGVKSGVPDILIFDSPPKYPNIKGLAIELKRKRGGKVSEEQEEWLDALEKRGWAAMVCYGVDGVLDALRFYGY